jgi:putative ABC transport system substrate-binding protein
MNEMYRFLFVVSQSDNRQSKTCGELCRRIKNRKWVGCVAILLLLTGWVPIAAAQQTGKIFRIGFLDVSTAAGTAVLLEAFRQELSKLGWIERKNIIIEYRFAEGNSERVPEFAADLVRLKVDLIVATGPNPTLAAKKASTTIPIVMAFTGDPIGSGLVVSLARPGGNVTGLSSLSTELNGKRLEVLKDAVPKLRRVGLLRPMKAADVVQLRELRPAALALKLQFIINLKAAKQIGLTLSPEFLSRANTVIR